MSRLGHLLRRVDNHRYAGVTVLSGFCASDGLEPTPGVASGPGLLCAVSTAAYAV